MLINLIGRSRSVGESCACCRLIGRHRRQQKMPVQRIIRVHIPRGHHRSIGSAIQIQRTTIHDAPRLMPLATQIDNYVIQRAPDTINTRVTGMLHLKSHGAAGIKSCRSDLHP